MKLNVTRLFRFALSIKRNQTISSFSTFVFFSAHFPNRDRCVSPGIHNGSWLNHHQMGLCTMCTSTLCASEYFNPLRNMQAAIIINTYYLHSMQRTRTRSLALAHMTISICWKMALTKATYNLCAAGHINTSILFDFDPIVCRFALTVLIMMRSSFDCAAKSH